MDAEHYIGATAESPPASRCFSAGKVQLIAEIYVQARIKVCLMSLVRLTGGQQVRKESKAGSFHALPWCCAVTATVGLGLALKPYA